MREAAAKKYFMSQARVSRLAMERSIGNGRQEVANAPACGEARGNVKAWAGSLETVSLFGLRGLGVLGNNTYYS